MKADKISSVWIIIGLLLVIASFSLIVYNLADQNRAMDASSDVLYKMDVLPEGQASVLDKNMEMPVKTIDGYDYIGVLRLPSLGLELPVISEWSYPGLKVAPCRYTGSVYQDDLIICAHNYASHFGRINKLQFGDGVTFEDMNGNVLYYQVAEIETLGPTAVEDMKAGDWDLTLFTCTKGGKTRVTVRCVCIPS